MTKIDLANCYWSIHLPPHLTRAMRVGVGDRSFAIVRVPFGWHQAPGLVQHLIATVIAHVDPGGVVVVQYVDDILVVGRQKQEVHQVTHDVTSALSKAGFLIGAKSILTPVAEVTWMGKAGNAQAGRIQPRPVAVADCVARWIRLAVTPLTQVSLKRLLGRLVWLGRPGNTAAAFWSGARAWLHFGPRWAPRAPPNLVGGLLEGLCCALRGWMPACTQHTFTSAPCLFVDAAQGPRGYWVGIWDRTGPWIRRCPRQITSEQSAEPWGVLAGLERAKGPTNLFVDNTGALSTALWGRAGITLPVQQRIMRRLAHRLRWQGGALQLHYVPSPLNPADPVSRWFSGLSARDIVVQAWARQADFLRCAHSPVEQHSRQGPAAVHHVWVVRLAARALAALTAAVSTSVGGVGWWRGLQGSVHCAVRFFAVFLMTRSLRTQRGRRGGRRHRRSAHAAARRAARALARIRSVRARRVGGRAVRRVFLGSVARLVFAVPFADSAAPDVPREAVCDIGDWMRVIPDQAVTFTGSRNVKGPRRHHCKHRWRLLMAEGPVYLSLSTHHREGRQALPYLWVQGRPALVWRVAALFAP